ncbi:MAG: ribosomal RNA small subunit methyltransferase A [Candidatus Omnitrophica bacterium]|nr:ribosomal RNA small subunit methyltransferase A [Candidatus Omnitrophota bacterium]
MYFRPKKYLGQNFLIDNNIQRKIVDACGITPGDTVLEVGAGRGELTKLLALKTDKVFALEIDRNLSSILQDNLSALPQVKVINQDVLQFNLLNFFKQSNRIKVVGNLPYYITTPIIVHLLQFRDKIGSIFVTIQKEFAQRMAALEGSGDWGAFSCYLQYYTEPEILFYIKSTCFRPRPKVDSAFVRLEIKRDLPLDVVREKRLFRIIRSSFQQRRKTLRNSLKGVVSSSRIDRFLNQHNLDMNIRGEKLALEDFINLLNVD